MDDQTEDDLADLVREVRKLYWLNVRIHISRITGRDPGSQERKVARYDGGTDRLGKQHKPVWPRLARHYLAAGVDPEITMQAAFSEWSGNQPPRPDQLLRPVEPPVTGTLTADEDITIAMTVERNVARMALSRLEETNLTPKAARRRVILDSTLDLSDLFRYCLACQAGERDLALDHYEPAVRQYVKQADAYDVALRAELPEPFRKEARRRLAEMLKTAPSRPRR